MADKKIVEKKIDKEVSDKLKRQLLFKICTSKEMLKNWVHLFLGIDLPDCIVDPSSNSNPMDLLWEIYEKAIDGKDPNFTQLLAFSARSAFKCVEKGTRILTKNKGLAKIEDLIIGDLIWTGWSWKKITNHINDGFKKGVRIKLNNGLELTTSPIHKIWAWEPNKNPDWKQASELTDKDIVMINTDHNYSANKTINNNEYEIGYICGILQGDGCLTLLDKNNSVALSTSNNYILNFWKNFCLKHIGKIPKVSKSRKYDWWIFSKELKNILYSYGLKPCYAFEKEIPELCYSSYSYMIGYITGIFDTDGYYNNKRKRIQLSITSEKIIKQLSIILHALGVNNSVRSNSKKYNIQNHIIHSLIIYQNDFYKLKEIGFNSLVMKVSSWKELLETSPKSCNNNDSIPVSQANALLSYLPKTRTLGDGILKPKSDIGTYPNISRYKFSKIVNWANDKELINNYKFWNKQSQNKWVKIKQINKIDNVEFYDLTVEGEHSYWSNGIISHNTLTCSIMCVLSLLHWRRSMCTIAALEQQSRVNIGYVTNYFSRDILKDFLISNSRRELEVSWYEDNLHNIISPIEYKTISNQKDFVKKTYSVQLLVATPKSTNSAHVPFLVLDELDLAPPGPLEEAKLIPDRGEKGQLPITFYTSSRKYAYGNVQKVIDNASQEGTHIRHWNIIDVTEPCPATRHLPSKPKIPIYVDEKNLKAISEKQYNLLSFDKQELYVKEEGYAGCLKRCNIFAQCLGRLATEQKSTSKLLKSIDSIQALFRQSNVDVAKAQLLCKKPSQEGMIYPRLDKDVHLITTNQIMQKITGDIYPYELSKNQLIQLFKQNEVQYYAGLDHGFAHCFAGTLGAKYGKYMFIIDAFEIPELELSQKIDVLNSRFRKYDPIMYPDTSDPSSNKTLKRAGFRVKEWKKGSGSVVGGIEVVRMKLNPTIGEPELYFLKDDEGCELAFKRLSEYHWKVDSVGKSTNVPTEDNDDLCFTEETEALTTYGWKSLKNINENDIILSVTERGEGIWEKSIKIIKKKFSGYTYTASNHNHLEFTATDDHKHGVISQMEWKVNGNYKLHKRTVEEMCGEMYWPNNLFLWPEGTGFFEQGEDEAWIAGFWLAEGCFNNSNPTYLLIDQTKEQHKDTLRDKIELLKWKHTETWSKFSKQETTYKVRFVITGQKTRVINWREWFGSGAVNKRLPIDIINKMNFKERSALWEGYMAGDGIRTQSAWHFDSISKSLIDSIQILTLSLGYGCRIVSYNCMKSGRSMISPANGKIYSNTNKIYRGHILKRASISHFKTNKFIKNAVNNLDVYCINTSTGYFYARTNGKPFVAGNCDSTRYLVMNVFDKHGRVVAPAVSITNDNGSDSYTSNNERYYSQTNWLNEILEENGVTGDIEEESGVMNNKGIIIK